MNVKVLHEKPQVIRMGSVRSAIPTDKAPSKVASLPNGSLPKVASQSNGALTKCSPPPPQKPQQQQQKPQHKPPFNSNVCFLCGKAGHYENQSSCNAANKKRNPYY